MSVERDKIIRYYGAQNQAELATRLLDLADGAFKTQKVKISEFLDPAGRQILETIAAHYSNLKIVTEGGFNHAERVKGAFVFQDFLGTIDFQIKALAVTWNKKFVHLSHRDVLGSIMALGLRREVFGDIVMTPDGCQIILDLNMASYVISHLNQIGSSSVDIHEIDLSELMQKEEKVKEIRTTVPSLRLDVVAASGFGISRSKMADEIKADKIKVNWQDARKSDMSVKAGDTISARGRGRVEVCEILGNTKKGRISLVLKRII